MSILLYLDEGEVSLIFKSIRYLRERESSDELNDLYLKLGLMYGDLDVEDYDGSASDSNYADGDGSTE